MPRQKDYRQAAPAAPGKPSTLAGLPNRQILPGWTQPSRSWTLATGTDYPWLRRRPPPISSAAVWTRNGIPRLCHGACVMALVSWRLCHGAWAIAIPDRRAKRGETAVWAPRRRTGRVQSRKTGRPSHRSRDPSRVCRWRRGSTGWLRTNPTLGMQQAACRRRAPIPARIAARAGPAGTRLRSGEPRRGDHHKATRADRRRATDPTRRTGDADHQSANGRQSCPRPGRRTRQRGAVGSGATVGAHSQCGGPALARPCGIAASRIVKPPQADPS